MDKAKAMEMKTCNDQKNFGPSACRRSKADHERAKKAFDDEKATCSCYKSVVKKVKAYKKAEALFKECH